MVIISGVPIFRFFTVLLQSFYIPTNGKNRRSTNHYKTDVAFRNDDKMSLDVLCVGIKRTNKIF